MKASTSLVLCVVLALCGSVEGKPKPKPQITMTTAKATALKRVSGRIKSAELEMEKGKLVYSFDIVTADKKIMEVLIDAMTGEVVDVEEETPEHERQEEREKRRGAGK
jgi:hypothetical protein